MKILELETTFDFVDERIYVHSTIMLSDVWEKLASHIPLTDDCPVLVDARFHRWMTCNGRICVYDENKDFSADPSLTTECRFYSGDKSVYVYVFEDKERPVINRVKSKYLIHNLRQKGDFSGSCEILVGDALSMVRNIVEANKRIHMAMYQEIESLKIINLYMKKYPITLSDDGNNYHRLVIKNLGVRTHGGSTTTLNRFEFPDLNCAPFEIAYLVEELT